MGLSNAVIANIFQSRGSLMSIIVDIIMWALFGASVLCICVKHKGFF